MHDKLTQSHNIHPVQIVGAGPGAADLLTVRAVRCIGQADVVLHDNLVSADILALCRKDAELIYTGKKYGDAIDPVERQQHIHELMAEHAANGKKVVRLKSGDPFIYGRAAEEVRYLQEHNIAFEVVPGLTAGIAAASLCQVPLTERNRSKAVLFCTGHTANYDFEQLEALANMLRTGTSLVMYMGLSNLPKVIAKLQVAAGAETIYVTAVSQVSAPTQQTVTATLSEIEAALTSRPLPMPVVFIIGKYADLL
ncbi:uroporphyrinogen-III C-methyltransferase [Chitinophaga sp. G-6-1-13]|uniref:uroporphyrinogen-III C-methyltransferase n=1 Tax=Chitinophaga fulva TaxID=2728842 RepID=A0A848GPJ6_9BACT|nr:uroporphyrinogen-III C-methyltransferase [Chitinophaga fulva]NML40416.1 uroporphyrinogen-III C-methyltransferase [Chitinophaga fulva]